MKTLSLSLLLALSPLVLGAPAWAGTDDACADGLDNDGDGWTDDDDPDCILGESEVGYGGDGCNDGEDNDDDGYVDADDDDCGSATDTESDDGDTDGATDGDTGDDDGDTDTDTDAGGTDSFFDEGVTLSETTDEAGGFGCIGNNAWLLLLPLPLLGLKRRRD